MQLGACRSCGGCCKCRCPDSLVTLRYATNDIIHKMFYLFLMLGVMGCGLNMKNAFHGHSLGYTISYCVARGMLVIMWAMVGVFNPWQLAAVRVYPFVPCRPSSQFLRFTP